MRLDGNLRYVALGDSQTEGIGDGDEAGGYRGWADRFAQGLAATGARQVREEQLRPALELRPDVATVFAGVNDLLRPGYEADAVVADLETMFAELTGVGARVATLTFPDIARIAPLARPLVPRVLDFNERVRAAAGRHGVAVADTAAYEISTDRRLWQKDRLHCSPEGHRRIAGAVAHALGIPGSDESWSDPLPPLPAPGALRTAAEEVRWLGSFLGPWVVRRLRGRSSGDGRVAKRAVPLPVEL